MSEAASLDQLARGAQNGRGRDLHDLLAQLRPMICRWAVIWTGSPDTAEDVAQTVLLRVNGSIRSYAPKGRFTTWAYRITKNVLIDYGRSHGREHALRDGLRLEEVARAVAVDDGARSFEAVDLLQHLMRALSPQQRAALDLVDLQGFSAQDAAEMLELAPATVRVHLHRARRVLRIRLRGEAAAEVPHE